MLFYLAMYNKGYHLLLHHKDAMAMNRNCDNLSGNWSFVLNCQQVNNALVKA